MTYIIVKKTERDIRTAGLERGLRDRSGLVRCEGEAMEISRRRSAHIDHSDKPLAFEDGGQADREMAERAGIDRDTWDRNAWEEKRRRDSL